MNWNQLTSLEVGSSWIWTAPILGNWFRFDVLPIRKISLEVAQGDGAGLIGEVFPLKSPSQTIYLPTPDILLPSQRRLALRTTGVDFQLGWQVAILAPETELSQPIERQILDLLQEMQSESIDGGVIG